MFFNSKNNIYERRAINCVLRQSSIEVHMYLILTYFCSSLGMLINSNKMEMSSPT
jgi:hypothetical protein